MTRRGTDNMLAYAEQQHEHRESERLRSDSFHGLLAATEALLATLQTCREVGKLKGGELAAEVEAREAALRARGLICSAAGQPASSAAASEVK